MIHAGSIHIFTICFKIQQIEDILRYLGEDDNQESAPPPHTYTRGLLGTSVTPGEFDFVCALTTDFR